MDFLLQWLFEPSLLQELLCPIDNIMHYLATLCSGYCGLQPGVPQAILWSLNIHHSAGDKHCCHLALLQMPLQHSVILCLHLWKEINVNMTIYGIHSFWAAPRTAVFVFPYCYGAQLQYPHMLLPLTGGAITSIPFKFGIHLLSNLGMFRTSMVQVVNGYHSL